MSYTCPVISPLSKLHTLHNSEDFIDLKVFWSLFGRQDYSQSVKCKSQHQKYYFITSIYLCDCTFFDKTLGHLRYIYSAYRYVNYYTRQEFMRNLQLVKTGRSFFYDNIKLFYCSVLS